jgi:hypothetical protein
MNFIKLVPILLSIVSFLSPVRGFSYSLQEIFQQQFNRLKTVANGYEIELGSLIFANVESSHGGNVNSNVIINLNEIGKYVKNQNEDFDRIFADLILGHELAHNMQYAKYKKQAIDHIKGEQMVFLECDADIIAGFLTSIILLNSAESEQEKKASFFDQAEYKKRLGTVVNSVFKKVIEMDNTNTMVKSHLNNEDRLLAIRDGIIIGNITGYFLQINNPDVAHTMTEQQLNQTKDLYNSLTRAMNFDLNKSDRNNPFLWAERQSILIAHENNSYVRNLVIYDENFEWHRTIADPTVDYSFLIMNLNPKSVNFSARICTEMVSRNDPANIINIVANDGISTDITIGPGESASFSGKLNWVADSEYMPHILLPGNPRSSYWAFDALTPEADSSIVISTHYDFDNWTENSITDIISYLFFLSARRENMMQYASGIGRSVYHDVAYVLKNRVFYDPAFETNHISGREIYKDLRTGHVGYIFTVFNTKDELQADQRFEEIEKAIEQTFKKFTTKYPVSVTGIRSIQFYENQDKVLKLSSTHSDESKDYVTKIEIFEKIQNVNLQRKVYQ